MRLKEGSGREAADILSVALDSALLWTCSMMFFLSLTNFWNVDFHEFYTFWGALNPEITFFAVGLCVGVGVYASDILWYMLISLYLE